MRIKKCLVPVISVIVLLFAGCDGKVQKTDGRQRISCGLPPVANIAARIAGEDAVVISMLPQGRSPHDYAPRPADIRDAGRSAVFFTTGMNFENNVVRAMPDNVKICDVSTGIRRRHFEDGKGCCDGHGHDHHHGEEALDPHVWLSPANAIVIAGNIADCLSTVYPEKAEMYRKNLAAFSAEVNKVDAFLQKELAPFAGREILVYHPAFGYFTDSYKMRQHPLEINGREMSATQLAAVIAKAKKDNIRVVFVQPQFNPRTAEELARRINGEAVPMDPLKYDLIGNFIQMSDAVRRGLGNKK